METASRNNEVGRQENDLEADALLQSEVADANQEQYIEMRKRLQFFGFSTWILGCVVLTVLLGLLPPQAISVVVLYIMMTGVLRMNAHHQAHVQEVEVSGSPSHVAASVSGPSNLHVVVQEHSTPEGSHYTYALPSRFLLDRELLSRVMRQIHEHQEQQRQQLPGGRAVEPISDTDLASLPVYTFQSTAKEQPTSQGQSEGQSTSSHPQAGCGHSSGATATGCSICLESFCDDEQVMVLPCAHQFHQECISSWLRTKGYRVTCPMCKLRVFPDDDE